MSARLLASGEGWRVVDMLCRSGPKDRPFEERHDWTCVAAVLGGSFTYRSRLGRALLAPGSLLLGESGACFQCGHEHGDGDRCVAFHFAPDLIEGELGTLKGVRRIGFSNASIPPVQDLLAVLARSQMLAETPDNLLGEEVALRVLATAFLLDQNAQSVSCDVRDEARAAQAVGIIEARYAEPLTIAGLAHEVGLRRRSFASAFKRAVGVTPYNYILGRRLAAAAERLRRDRSSVLEIALDVGFCDLSEFTRRFHAKFGLSPGLYQRAGRAPAPIWARSDATRKRRRQC
jgi:AraC family transcriptional regulator